MSIVRRWMRCWNWIHNVVRLNLRVGFAVDSGYPFPPHQRRDAL